MDTIALITFDLSDPSSAYVSAQQWVMFVEKYIRENFPLQRKQMQKGLEEMIKSSQDNKDLSNSKVKNVTISNEVC
jgi:hypothetical protein